MLLPTPRFDLVSKLETDV
uniref:Uncharacterized protein n=1 Tax=Rhizophora mucronata TaxID=61149 RepID=A0A2P2Q1P5_RHIMU